MGGGNKQDGLFAKASVPLEAAGKTGLEEKE